MSCLRDEVETCIGLKYNMTIHRQRKYVNDWNTMGKYTHMDR